MLVLSRRVGEEIVIDGQIRIVVVEAKGNRIRLGICAPPSVTVNRKEVHIRLGIGSPPSVSADREEAPERQTVAWRPKSRLTS